MTKDEAIQRMFQVVSDEARHEFYKDVCDYADLCTALVTGKNLNNYLRRFTPRESEELFAQREELTQHVAPGTMRKARAAYKKGIESRHTVTMKYVEAGDVPGGRMDEEEKMAAFKPIFDKFFGNKDVTEWVKRRVFNLKWVDPNAFLVVEFAGTDGVKRAKPYPFEVRCSDALDFGHENEVLKYLIVQTERKTMKSSREPAVKNTITGQLASRKRYTCYLENQTIILEPMPDDKAPHRDDGKIFDTGDGSFVWLKTELYQIVEPIPHNLGVVPAFRAGHDEDLSNSGMTYVTSYHEAIPFLRKSLKINSELDLAMTLVAHPERHMYLPPCEAEGCNKGYLPDGHTQCTVCKGSGKKISTSVAEAFTYEIPRDKEDFFDLDKMSITKMPPIEAMLFQREMIEWCSGEVLKIIFNTDTFSQKEIAVSVTATEKTIDLQNAQVVIYEALSDLSEKWQFTTIMCARITDLEKGLVASLYWERDLQLKSVGQLFEELKSAQDSSAPPEVVSTLQEQIVNTLYADNDDERKRYEVRGKFNPFRGVSESVIMTILNSDLTSQRNKIQYVNLGNIFDELEADYTARNVDFYALPYVEQKAAIALKVNALISELTPVDNPEFALN
jgi:hypothetical protein